MIYKASYKSVFINVLSIIILLIIVLLIKSIEIGTSFLIIAVIVGAYLFFLTIEKKPIRIKTTDSDLIITFNRFLIYNTQISEKISELTQSFKKEIGPRGIKINVFRIYKGGTTILKIVSSYSGWSTEKLRILSKNLQVLGVNLINQGDL